MYWEGFWEVIVSKSILGQLEQPLCPQLILPQKDFSQTLYSADPCKHTNLHCQTFTKMIIQHFFLSLLVFLTIPNQTMQKRHLSVLCTGPPVTRTPGSWAAPGRSGTTSSRRSRATPSRSGERSERWGGMGPGGDFFLGLVWLVESGTVWLGFIEVKESQTLPKDGLSKAGGFLFLCCF